MSHRGHGASRRHLGGSRTSVCASAVVVLSAWPASAAAQLRWDAGASVGVTRRVLSQRAASDAGIGPAVGLTAHVAFVPLVRLGAYVMHDRSPVEATATRSITSLGVRVKLLSPWPRPPVRVWVVTGLGYALVFSDGPRVGIELPSAQSAGGARNAYSVASDGGFVQVPFSVGVGYRVRKPWALTFELLSSVGVGFGGSIYRRRDVDVTNGRAVALLPQGNDAFAIGLAFGVSYDP